MRHGILFVFADADIQPGLTARFDHGPGLGHGATRSDN
jgi:hypothetical protein